MRARELEWQSTVSKETRLYATTSIELPKRRVKSAALWRNVNFIESRTRRLTQTVPELFTCCYSHGRSQSRRRRRKSARAFVEAEARTHNQFFNVGGNGEKLASEAMEAPPTELALLVLVVRR
jgi:hypothetical protein